MTKPDMSLSNIFTTPAFILTIATTLVVAISILIVFTKYLRLSSKKSKKHNKDSQEENQRGTNNTTEPGSPDHKRQISKTKAKSKAHQQHQRKPPKVTYNHPWLLTTLKAHGGKVLDLDFDSNKKYLASCADDRSVVLWTIEDLAGKEHKFIRGNVELDYGLKVKWTPDSKTFIICRASDNALQVYNINKKSNPSSGLRNIQVAMMFPTQSEDELVGLGVASTGKYIMTCSYKGALVIWNLKGDKLTSFDTHQLNVYYATVSPCGRFIASCGFTSDVKVWQVLFDKSGAFKEVRRVYELKGHSAGVESFAFNDDSSRMASVSKDETWKLWNTQVEFEKGQEPYLLLTRPCKHEDTAKLSLSPDGRVVVIATGSLIHVYSGVSGNREKTIDNQAPISVILFEPYGKWFLVAVEKHIRIFHNVTGYRVTIQDLEERRKAATNQSLKERIQQQINEARSALEAISEK